MKNYVLAAALIGSAMCASAQEQVGKLMDVRGTITVGTDGALVKATNGTAVTANSTILVSTGAKATLLLKEGCVIGLTANQHLTLDPKLTCAQQVSAVKQLMTPYRVAQGAPVSGISGAAGGGTAGGLTALAVGGAIAVSGAVLLNEVSTSGN